MTDPEFLERFDRCTLDDFTHRDHVRLAWILLRSSDHADVADRVRTGIRRFAAHHGAAGKYHETITLGWLAVVADALDAAPAEPEFDRFLEAHPDLLDRDRLLEHYSADTLASDAARARWIEPDRRAFALRARTR